MKRPPRVTDLAFLVALLIATGTAQAHIPQQSPYESKPFGQGRPGFGDTIVPTQIACQISNIVFAVLQLAGALFLGLVLRVCTDPKGPERRSRLSAFSAAFLVQVAVTVLLLVCNFFVFIPLNLGSSCFHLNPSGFEVVYFFRRALIDATLVMNAISFGVATLLSRAMLAAFSLHGNKWGIAFLHALVFHPLALPVGLLIALMWLIYTVRAAGKPPPRAALDLE